MRKFMLVAAIASLSFVNAGAALAQAAVGEPGLSAFNHPDADILHAGPGYSGFALNPAMRWRRCPSLDPRAGAEHGRTQ